MVKSSTLYLLLSLVLVGSAWADTYKGVLFENSIVSGNYQHSHVDHDSLSWVENVVGLLPVCDSIFFTPGNALSLKYTSAADGMWNVQLNFPETESRYLLDTDDVLTFKIYITSEVQRDVLPRLALRLTDSLSRVVNLAEYISDFSINAWLDVRVPLSAFGVAASNPITGVQFSQGEADTATHLLYVDQVEFVKANSPQVPLSSPAMLATVKAYDRHVDLTWQLPLTPSIRYIKIYRGEDKEHLDPIAVRPVFVQKYTDVVPYPEKTYFYKITWVDYDYRESPSSDVVEATTHRANDSELLDFIQAAHVNYFVERTEINSGMHATHFGVDDATVSVKETGWSLLSYVVGVERGFISRRAAMGRLRRIVGFLEGVERYHGAFPGLINGRTGEGIFAVDSIPEADVAATASLMQGLLVSKQYFAADSGRFSGIAARIDSLWRGVEWNAFTIAGQDQILLDRWSPVAGFRTARPMGGFGQDFVSYILALASPTHALPQRAYHEGLGVRRELVDSTYAMELAANNSFAVDTGSDSTGIGVLPEYREYPYKADTTVYGLPIVVGEVDASLMEAYLPFLAFDPRTKQDTFANYFTNNINLTNVVKRRDHELGHGDFSTMLWGTTEVHTDTSGYVRAINPAIATASYAYTPKDALLSIRDLYERYGSVLFTEYGFRQWIAPRQNAVASGYDALNQAAVVVMLENGRSGLVWSLFGNNPYIKKVVESHFDTE